MIENLEDHMTHTCKCGSVNFALLKSSRIECNKCGELQSDARWGEGPLGFQIRRAIAAEDTIDALQERFKAAEDKLVSIKGQEPMAFPRNSYCVASTGEALYTETQVRKLLAAGAQPTIRDFRTVQSAQELKPLFKEFIIWAEKHGYDCANTCNSDTGEWICLNPMTADLWHAWQAAHGITEQP